MAVRIEFETTNAAFAEGDGHDEAALILRQIADNLERGSGGGTIRDSNGNRIGSWEATIDAEDEDARDFREASE